MSAIASILGINGACVPESLARRVVYAGWPRGRDQQVLRRGSSVAIGGSFLKITPEDTMAVQPVECREQHLLAVVDGRLDNRPDLLSQLSIDPLLYNKMSDCEVALAAYRRWGTACASRLIGSFALMIWDGERSELFCAVDHLATRPLFYMRRGDHIAVASMLRQLRQFDDATFQLDNIYLLSFLCLPVQSAGYSPRTPYVDVFRLMPGHILQIRSDGAWATVRYWHPEALPDDTIFTLEESAERVRETFLTVMKSHLRTSCGVMTTLSGGLDSAGITCTAINLARNESGRTRPILPLSMTGLWEPSNEDAECRKSVAQAYDVVVRELQIEEDDSAFVWSGPLPDEPACISWSVPQIQQAALIARENNCNVIFWGNGGDELMQGRDECVADALVQRRLRTFWKLAWERTRITNQNILSSAWLYGIAPVMNYWIGRTNLAPLVCMGELYDDRAISDWLFIPPWISRDACTNHEFWKNIRQFSPRCWPALPSRRLILQDVVQNDPHVFYEHITASVGGCEVRLPFLDRRFVEVALTTPEHLKQQIRSNGGRTPKIVWREAMKGILPENVRVRRGKGGTSLLAQGAITREISRLADSRRFEVVDHGFIEGGVPALRARLERMRLGLWIGMMQTLGLIQTECWLRALAVEEWTVSDGELRAANIVATEMGR